jgi:hypothetical protein
LLYSPSTCGKEQLLLWDFSAFRAAASRRLATPLSEAGLGSGPSRWSPGEVMPYRHPHGWPACRLKIPGGGGARLVAGEEGRRRQAAPPTAPDPAPLAWTTATMLPPPEGRGWRRGRARRQEVGRARFDAHHRQGAAPPTERKKREGEERRRAK